MTKQDGDLLRLSLVFVWLTTAVVSVGNWQGQSERLLEGTVVQGSAWVPVLIWGGAAVDLMLGLAMCWRPSRQTYQLALLVMLLMTVVATLLTPGLWLHPLGPLTKNVPIAAMLIVLARRAE